MAHALTQLRSLLRPSVRSYGKVQRIEGGTVYVSTPRGIVMAAADSVAGLRVGSSVSLDGDKIASVKIADEDLPIFSV